MALHTGCNAVRSLGLLPEQDDLALSALTVAVQRAAVKHGLPADILTDAEIREIAAILAAQTRLDEIASAKASRADIQERAAALIDRYIIAPVPSVPSPGGTGSVPSIPAAAIPSLAVVFGGTAGQSAEYDPRYILAVSPDGRDWSPMPDDWQTAPGLYPGICCAAYQRPDGSWVGGKFEWLPRPPRPRNWGNIANGYTGGGNAWVPPASGTPMILWVVEGNGRRRSSFAHAFYP
jgi:hypothetical protein